MKRCVFSLMLICLLSACQPVDFSVKMPDYDSGIDPNGWVTIPAGAYYEGQFNHEASIDYDYEMMVTPVTISQYVQFLNAALADGSARLGDGMVVGYYGGDPFQGARHEEEIKAGDFIYVPLDGYAAMRFHFDGQAFTVEQGWENHPMTYVSWFGARAYCENQHGRLPGEQEWEKAARGTDMRPFPWGFEIERNQANFINSRDPYEDMSNFGSLTTPVGFYNGRIYGDYQTLDSASPYGLYDMAGNVWQWTGDVYDSQHYRYMRGGSKDLYPSNLRLWVRNNATPTFVSPAIGFRCAR